MKKLLPLMLVALGALTSCAGGKVVSRAEYIEKAEAVEAHPYTKATVTMKETTIRNAIDEEDIAAQVKAGEKNIVAKLKETKEVVDVKEEFTYDAEEQEWIYAGEGESKSDDYVGVTALYLVGPEESTSEEMDSDDLDILNHMKYTYYVDPFKVTVKIDYNDEIGGQKVVMSGNSTTLFDKYGLMTSQKSKTDMKLTFDDETLASMAEYYKLAGVTVDFSKAKTSTNKTDLAVTISYK